MIDITFLVKPSEINAKGQCIIYCRFKCDGTPKKEISTGIQVSPDEFDSSSKRIITKGKKSDSELLLLFIVLFPSIKVISYCIL